MIHTPNTSPLLHVKVTNHFIDVAKNRGWDDVQAAELWRLIATNKLMELAAPLRHGERGAVAVAGVGRVGAVVFMRDERDPNVLVLMTYLSQPELAVLSRRRDTRLMGTT